MARRYAGMDGGHGSRRKARWRWRRRSGARLVAELVVAAFANQSHRVVDVAERAIAPFAGARVVFFALDIVAGAVEQAQNFAETAAAAEARIDGRVVVQIFAVEHGGGVELADGALGEVDGGGHVAVDVRLIGDAHEQSRAAQVAAGVKISGVTELGGRERGQRECHQDGAFLKKFII